MREVFSTHDQTQAIAVKIALNAAGIQAVVSGDSALAGVAGGFRVTIPEDQDYPRAIETVRSIERSTTPVQLRHPRGEIKALYEKRWTNHLTIGIALTVFIATVLLSGWVPAGARLWIVVAGLLGFGILDDRVWRCPNCGRAFGRTLWQLTCPSCHVDFRELG